MRDENYRWGDDPADHRALDAWLTRSDTDVWGDLVSVYTRADALADGVLRDATDAARELGIALPAALTAGAWEDLGCDDPVALRRVLGACALAMVMESMARRGDVARADLVLAGPRGWVACWAAADGDGLTIGLEGED